MDIEKLRKKFPEGVIRSHHPYYMSDAIHDIPGCLQACAATSIVEQIQQGVVKF